MQRDFAALSSRPFDVAVVGGGIYGACIAAEAVAGGLAVCLIESRDFGHATSANSLRVMHGGLRYLQHLDFKRMRESIAARREWLARYPRLAAPMQFSLPTFGHGLRGPEVYGAAMRLNNLVSFDANRRVPADRRLAPARVLSRDAGGDTLDSLNAPGANGLAVWEDGFVANTDRLLITIVAEAAAAGAVCCNYARAAGLVTAHGRVSGVRVEDEIGGGSATVAARAVVDATGPGTGAWHDLDEERAEFFPSRAFNLLTRRLRFDSAVGIPVPERDADPDARLRKGYQTYFVVPHGEYSLIGTKHLPSRGRDERIAPEEVAVFVAEIDAALACETLGANDVLRVYEGVLPANDPGSTALAKSPVVSRSEHVHGLVTVVGVKWTTARVVARQVVRIATAAARERGRGLGRRQRREDRRGQRREDGPGPKRERPRPDAQPGADSKPHPPADGDAAATAKAAAAAAKKADAVAAITDADIDPERLAARLTATYGNAAPEILELANRYPDLAICVQGRDLLGAELIWAARHEMAETLADVVFRRTTLGMSGAVNPRALDASVRLLAAERGWSEQRCSVERDSVERELGRLQAQVGRDEVPDAGR